MTPEQKERKQQTNAAWHQRNKERRAVSNAKSKAKRVARAKEFIAEWRRDGCIICGEAEPCVLDSHHTDPSTKEHAVADLIRDARMERLEAELRKTVTLCSNCHRKVHAGVIVL